MAAARTIPPPTPEVLEQIRRHHREAHGRGLDADRDIYTARGAPPEAIYDWQEANAKTGARFWCNLCGPGMVFTVGGPPHGTTERRAFLRSNDHHLQALLAGTPPERHDDLIDAYDRRELGPAMLAATDARKRRQTAVRHNPTYAQRIEGFRRYFFDAYARTGSIDRACEQLVDLHSRNIDAYRSVLGANRLFAFETLRNYVKQHTTAEERHEAKARWRAMRARHPTRA